MRVGNMRGITAASPGSCFSTTRASDRSGIQPQWLPIFLASVQSSSPPPSPPPPPPSPPLSPPPPSPSPPRSARLDPTDAEVGAVVIAGYVFLNIVVIMIVKTYLRFQDWDRGDFYRVLQTRMGRQLPSRE